MNPKFCHIGEPEDIAVEECSELIKAIMKARRFGLDNRHPKKPITNRSHILDECEDVLHAVKKLKRKLSHGR